MNIREHTDHPQTDMHPQLWNTPDPSGEADTIIQLWQDHPEGISDRAIARKLGRPQKTFADQMKKYRTDLRRIAGDK